ncbi:MAG: DUF3078 domain-containing protein [Bacteroidia bacterium]|jgi:hypothetical protein|nr:DUF3078 domain-containing protein [Bacteroidia bacterium]
MKRKFIAVIILFSIFSIITFSQVTEGEKTLRTQSADTTQGWKKGGVIATNLAQTSLTNWAAGGQNSLAVNGIFSLFANMKKGKSVWDNSLDLGYGILKQGKNTDFRKTDDKIDFLSKYGRLAFKNVYYAAMLNFKTQMTPGYNYLNDTTKVKISNLFAPAYLLLALGLDYKPNANLSVFLAPLTAKFTFVTDDTLSAHGAFGVTPGEKTKSEMGGYLRAIYTKNDFQGEFMKNISFTTKIDLFSNYADNPQNIDVSWETLIAMKVNKYITVSLNTHLLYDDNVKIQLDTDKNGIIDKAVGSKVQFKEILGVGFSYKF